MSATDHDWLDGKQDPDQQLARLVDGWRQSKAQLEGVPLGMGGGEDHAHRNAFQEASERCAL